MTLAIDQVQRPAHGITSPKLGERLGLAPTTVQGEHPLTRQPFAERMRGEQPYAQRSLRARRHSFGLR
jgi:hypothetical protein